MKIALYYLCLFIDWKTTELYQTNRALKPDLRLIQVEPSLRVIYIRIRMQNGEKRAKKTHVINTMLY